MENGAVDPNSPNYEDDAPIHSLIKWKAKKKKEKSVRMHLLVTLLTFGDTLVDIEKEDGDGHRALHLAVMVSFSLIMCVLTEECTVLPNINELSHFKLVNFLSH